MSHPLFATSVEPPDFKTLVADAEVIFTGEVTEVRAEWVGENTQRHIESFVSFQVLRSMKGSPGGIFVLNQVGGTVGPQTLEIAGAPKWRKGDRAILFVEKNGTQVVPLVGMMHGYFPLHRDKNTGKEVTLRHDGSPLRDTKEIDEISKQKILENHDNGSSKMEIKSATGVRSGMSREDFERAIEQQKDNISNPP